MKDAPWADAAPKPVGSTARASDITRAKALLTWKQKIILEEDLKKAINMYTNTRKLKRCIDEKLIMETLLV